MATAGFVIGFSENTATNPTTYWGGDEQIEELDDAEFFTSITQARTRAGELQTSFPESHVEAYSATKSVVHDPVLGAAGI